jgi:hypothetical protein
MEAIVIPNFIYPAPVGSGSAVEKPLFGPCQRGGAGNETAA